MRSKSLQKAVLAVAAVAALSACASRNGTAPPVGPGVAEGCADFSFPIYFQTNSDRLTEPAAEVIRDAATRTRGCRVSRVDVVGLADAGGTAALNMALSRRRADAVAGALAAAGLPRPAFDVDAAGEAGALTPDGRPEPLRRRTEVIVRMATPGG